MSDIQKGLPIRTENNGDAAVKITDGTVTSQLLKVESDGSINVNAAISATDLDIRDLNSATDSVTVVATDLDVRDLSHSQDSVKIGDGTDFLAVNTDGSINVKIADGSPGTEVTNYDTAAAVAGGASSTHTYTSTGNFYLQQIECSASGRAKWEVQVNGSTKFVKFTTESDNNCSIQLAQPILATSGQTVTVIRTNRQNQAQDLYSTISGYLA